MKKRKLVPNGIVKDESYPYRNIESLYTSSDTLNCALSGTSTLSSSIPPSPCIPCAYKIATFDIALDRSFTESVRNTRPELCPRSKDRTHHAVEGSYGYNRHMKILTIGDGDLSFSLGLARLFHKAQEDKEDKEDKEESISIVATSYESLSTLKNVYPSVNETISELEAYNFVQIIYEVDATNLDKTLPEKVREMKFHRIIWNFPCTAESNGQDGQNGQMDQNKKLVERFVKNCIPFMYEEVASEIQMIHKTKPPYHQWKIEEVALNGWKNTEDEDEVKDNGCPLEYKGRIVFDKCLLPPYVPRKALDKKSFPCHDACLYVFGWKDSLLTAQCKICRIKSTIPKQEKHDVVDDEKETSEVHNRFIRVNKKIIDQIRDSHLQYAKRKIGQKSKKKGRTLKWKSH